MNFSQKIQVVWQNISLVQRVLLIALALMFAGVAAVLVQWARRPDMRMLYQELSVEEASKVTEKIAEKGIAYELRNGGTTIYAPKEHIYQLRLDMAREGLAVSEQGGYKLFESEKIGTSPFAQEVHYQRAMQEELAKSIQMIEGVAFARVHIVNPEKSIFASKTKDTTASVVLRIRPGYRLSVSNIAAITNLVAGSVDGLNSDNVTVVDSQGQLLSTESSQGQANGAATVQTYRERVEQSLETKAEDMLEAVLGPGRAAVRVSAVIDMNSVSTVTEKYEPKGIVSKEEIQKGSETEPGGSDDGKGTKATGRNKEEETITTEYVNPKSVEQRQVLPGKIVSISASVVVDLTVYDANDTAAAGTTGAKIMQLADVEKLIRNTLGLDPTDADALTVVDAKFHRPVEAMVEEEQPSNWPKYMAIVRQGSLGIMAVCAMLVLLTLRKGKKKAAEQMAVGQLPTAEGGYSTSLAVGGEMLDPTVLRRQIAGALRKNPEHVRQVFASWLESEEV